MSTTTQPMSETEFREGCGMVEQGHVKEITYVNGCPVLVLKFAGEVISTASFLLMQGKCGHNCARWREEICEPVGKIDAQNRPVIELKQGLIQPDL